jgi:hypothetical protein
MSKLGSIYIAAGEPDGELCGEQLEDWAGHEIERLREELANAHAKGASLRRLYAAEEELAAIKAQHGHTLTLNGMTVFEFTANELYEFQEATGCTTADEFKAQPAQEPVHEWYCPTCRRVCDPVEVTYTEHHEACGTPVVSIPQQAQEPVAKIIRNSAGQIGMFALNGDHFDMRKFIGAKLYTAPQPTHDVEAALVEFYSAWAAGRQAVQTTAIETAKAVAAIDAAMKGQP